jgi:Ca-activated chloride channel homolog
MSSNTAVADTGPSRGGALGALARKLPLPLLFAIACAVGCLVGAIIGEIFLKATDKPPEPTVTEVIKKAPPQKVALLLDVSGSMLSQNRLAEVKQAAINFVNKRDLNKDHMALVKFSSSASVVVPMTGDASTLVKSIEGLIANGGTATDQGLQLAIDEVNKPSSLVGDSGAQKVIVLFTDGMPDSGSRAPSLALAKSAQAQNIAIVAVGTGQATESFLKELTPDVFAASSGKDFKEAFDQVEKRIEKHRTDSIIQIAVPDSQGGSSEPVKRSLFDMKVLVYGALLALGICFALVIANNLANGLRRMLINTTEMGTAFMVGVLAGAVGIFGGQALYYSFQGVSPFVSRLIGWTFLGSILGLCVLFFVPNVKWTRTVAGGAFGGAVASLSLILFATGSVPGLGRVVGATILGFCIGLMIAAALVLGAYSEAHLIVHHGKEKGRPIPLGSSPVILGSSSEAHIWIKDAPPVAGHFLFSKGVVTWNDLTKKTATPLPNGQKLSKGHIVIEVVATPKASS